jgi:RHS repeat-associated protein
VGLLKYVFLGDFIGMLNLAQSDPETAPSYYRARYYDPQAGRFLSEDPMGFDGGDNGYSYADNSPNGFTDPSGLSPWGRILDWYLNKYHPIDPLPVAPPRATCPLAPTSPCDSTNGRPYDPRNHPARDFSTPEIGSPITAPEDSGVSGVNSGGRRIEPPYDFTQPAPAGSTNFVSVNTASGYNITYFHITPSVRGRSDVMSGGILGITDDTGRQVGVPGHHTHVQVKDPAGHLIDPLLYFRNCL